MKTYTIPWKLFDDLNHVRTSCLVARGAGLGTNGLCVRAAEEGFSGSPATLVTFWASILQLASWSSELPTLGSQHNKESWVFSRARTVS